MRLSNPATPIGTIERLIPALALAHPISTSTPTWMASATSSPGRSMRLSISHLRIDQCASPGRPYPTGANPVSQCFQYFLLISRANAVELCSNDCGTSIRGKEPPELLIALKKGLTNLRATSLVQLDHTCWTCRCGMSLLLRPAEHGFSNLSTTRICPA